MQTKVVFHRRNCYGARFQTPNEESEDSHTRGRTSYNCGSRDCCAIDSGLLLTPCPSGSTGIGGSELPVGILTSLATRHCGSPAVHRLHPALRPARPVPEAKPVEHRLVLG